MSSNAVYLISVKILAISTFTLTDKKEHFHLKKVCKKAVHHTEIMANDK